MRPSTEEELKQFIIEAPEELFKEFQENVIEIMEEESTIPTRSTSEADFICGLSGQHLHLEKVGVVEMTGIKAVRQSVLYQTILEVEYNAIFKSRSYLTPADQGPIKISRQHGSASFTAP